MSKRIEIEIFEIEERKPENGSFVIAYSPDISEWHLLGFMNDKFYDGEKLTSSEFEISHWMEQPKI